MNKTKLKTGGSYTRALIDKSSFNDEMGTVDFTFATETPILVRSGEEQYYEILDCKPESIRFDRLNSGAPLLNNHDKYAGVFGVLGKVERSWIESNEARCTVRFSKRDEVAPIKEDVKDGILNGVSVGYRVFLYRLESTNEETGIPTYRAIDWEPLEVSLAPIPADYNSKVRSENYEVEIQYSEILNSKSNAMTEEEKRAEEARLAAENAAKTPPTDGVRTAVEVDKIKNEVLVAERSRVSQITNAVRSAKLDESFAQKLIEDGTSIDQARALIIDKFAATDSARGTSSISPIILADESDKRRSGMEDAIINRVSPGTIQNINKNEYRSMSLLGLATEVLVSAGINTRGLSDAEIARTAMCLTRSGSMSTSDFPIILGNTVNRVLRKQYEFAERTFMPFCNRGEAKDFRQMTKVQMSELAGFDKVIEGGEYTYGTFSEGKEVYAISKYGKIFAITWEMVVNDDLSAFNRIPSTIGNLVAQNQSNIVWGIITANAAMGDNVALFHATHGNLTGTGTAISVASLAKGKELMRKQKSLGDNFINLTPKFLIVPPELEAIAEQFTSSAYTPNQSSLINTKSNTQLQVIVEPRLSANSTTAWYLAASPSQVDTIEYSFLSGEPEVYTEHRTSFEKDGEEIKVRSTFGAKAIDYRGLYKNVGA